MKKYEYKNATVYITTPTEKHMENIRKATEVFLKKALKEGIFDDNKRKSDRGASLPNPHARRGNQKTKK